MMKHLLHVSLLLAIQLLVCPKPGRAITYLQEEVSVPATWKILGRYHNDNIRDVVEKITHTSGMTNHISETRTIEATHSVGVIAQGTLFKILELTFSYNFAHRRERVTMRQNEIYESRTRETTVTIPPKSTLTRWELIADVAGTKISYSNNFDILNDTRAPADTPIGLAKVLVPRRINYGHTRIRIKHLEKNEFITVTERSNWPAATLGYASNYLFVLCKDSRGTRIKTLNSTHPGYVWAYSSTGGGVYFDWNRELGRSYLRNENIQRWIVSKDEPLYDGDVVSFKNKHYHDSFMCHHVGPETNVYCLERREDRWVLETASAGDSSGDNCI